MDQRKMAYDWIAKHKQEIPQELLSMVEMFQALETDLKNEKIKRQTILTQLRKALGIIPSSEKKKTLCSRKNKDDKTSKASLLSQETYHKDRCEWHKNQFKKHEAMRNMIGTQIKSIDEIELSQEEKDQIQKEIERENEILNSGETDLSLAKPKEALMSGIEHELNREELDVPLPEPLPGQKLTDSFIESRTRYHFEFLLTAIDIRLHKGRDSSGSLVSRSLNSVGPEGYQITWGFLVTVVFLVTQYAMPFERIARMVSTPEKSFSSSQIYRYFLYAAQRLLPIYICLGKSLSQSDFLSGDDSNVLVLEAQRNKGKEETTWSDYATMEKAEEFLLKNPHCEKLGPKLASEFGFEFEKKDGKGNKTQLYISLIHGKADQTDPTSYVVFYRSHLGSFGNILDTILQNRNQNKTDLFVQCDLLSGNKISDLDLLKKLNIKYFGCASLARRPFALYEDQDPLCAGILAYFRNIYHSEKGLDLYGRNRKKVYDLRQESQKKCWYAIKDSAQLLTQKWPSTSAIGKGAKYILNHYPELTAYLDHPEISLTNDCSERFHRMEKLIQAGSMFRNSLEGRFALDICRTVVQTCLASGVSVTEYLTQTLQKNDQELASRPQDFTPYAFLKTEKEADS